MTTDNKIAILGSGPMALILSSILSPKMDSLDLYALEGAEKLVRDREGLVLGQPFGLPTNVHPVEWKGSVDDGTILVVAVPSRELEETMEKILRTSAGLTVVLFTKGLVSPAGRRKYGCYTFCDFLTAFSEDNGLHGNNFAAVNGPSLLAELHYQLYSFFNIGCASTECAEYVAGLFNSEKIRTAWTTDVLGLELGGVMKNPLAIACGIADGISGCGSNFQGELIARGFQEMLLLGTALGARQETLTGRSGLADLITTSISPDSRNRAYGKKFINRLNAGENEPSFGDKFEILLNPSRYIQKEVLQQQDLVEGAFAISSILEIAKEKNIELPLYSTLYDVLSRRKAPQHLASLLTGDRSQDSVPPPVAKRAEGLNFTSGRSFLESLRHRVFHRAIRTKGMQSRIKRQASQVLSLLERKLKKAEKESRKIDLVKVPKEITLWQKLELSDGGNEREALEGLIAHYTEEIADSYRPGMRETLIRLLLPARFFAGGMKSHSAVPQLGGKIEEVKKLSSKYNILYAPTHRSHLDSVEVAFGLTWLGLPLPRYAAGINLMTGPMWSWLLRSFGAYAVDREKTRNILYLECLSSYATLMLESGIPSLVYPEGTRSRTGGVIGIKTGLLSTAIEAFRNTGREVIIVPLALSYECVPEDEFFCGLEVDEPSMNEFISKRGRVYMDLGEPVPVSRHIKAEEPALSLAYQITSAWQKSHRILPNQLVSRILVDHGYGMDESLLRNYIDEYLTGHPGNYLIDRTDDILTEGMKVLEKRQIVIKKMRHVIGLKPELLTYYGNMVPGGSSPMMSDPG